MDRYMIREEFERIAHKLSEDLERVSEEFGKKRSYDFATYAILRHFINAQFDLLGSIILMLSDIHYAVTEKKGKTNE